jgi:putative transposase
MARLPRVVVPGVPHHVTQRGNRRQTTFFSASDYRRYLFTLARVSGRWDVDIWTYCLMPNHVHLILVPSTVDSLTPAIAELHRTYTWDVNRRHGWTGCLWQGRYFSFPMDEQHLLGAARYALLNPVRAGLSASPTDWPYSSAQCHARGQSDGIVNVGPLAKRVGSWQEFLAEDVTREERDRLRLHQRTGRPLGDHKFLLRLQTRAGRALPG